ncbi:hypothetical protein M501DRAFT_925789 [Patellaria atrata CBS 101060]|uniref:Small ribosomal subunit protein mS29 n=1 Tax=Patellaria atrata CBS 101060 TaxID=1346257 RepID=A0A9P4SJI8_9PEZI|nr:hypothetical protein M501DRAFT_925789 [Patellaria atrata CBS 101060]
MKKTKVQKATSRAPAIGERKALRKRVILSNTNALEVDGMPDLFVGNMAVPEVAGKMVGLPGPVVDSLRAAEAFKVTQGWSLFRKPAVLMRSETVEMGKLIQNLDAQTENRKTIRKIIAGERGSGKSVLLLQAMAMAYLKGWIVINIPDAKDLVQNHAAYAPIPDSQPLLYLQKTLTASLLDRLQKSNPILTTLTLSKPHTFPLPLSPQTTLSDLALHGISDPDLAWPAFTILWTELTSPSSPIPGATRPPILLALDGLAHALINSHYLTRDAQPIHAHDLALVSFFLRYLRASPPTDLPNGGLVLAAMSASNAPSCPALRLAVSQSLARQRGEEVPEWDPYRKIDTRALEAVSGVDVLGVGGLSKVEARAVLEYYAASGVVRERVDARYVGEAWTVSGGGLVGELERGAVRMRV